MKINIIKDGPYRVSGGAPLSTQTIGLNEGRESINWIEVGETQTSDPYFLCRCGRSASKPFCDGSHSSTGFDGAETAPRAPFADQASELHGATLTLLDVEHLCAAARFCDRAGSVWANVESLETDAQREALIEQVGQCPSGRLALRDLETGARLEPKLPPSIVLVEDPAAGLNGPIWVRGGVAVVASDGALLETRNRVTLCRCGESANKPYCDGSHARIDAAG